MIFIFIYSGKFNSKHGGHFQSVKTIAESLASIRDVQIIVLGHSMKDIYSEAGLHPYFFKVTIINFPIAILRLLKYIKKYSPTNLHAFDNSSYFFVRILSYLNNTPSCLTKCGGPNFKHLALSQNTIFFSKENLDYYSKLKKFDRINKYLIPNRVMPQNINKNRLEKTKIDPNFTGLKFLRINRIGEYYKKTMIDSINLVNFLNNIEVKSKLYIVGIVTEENVLNELLKNENVVILNDEQYYKHASELIPLFDCVIGTGRSAMEAFSYGKIVFSPIINGDLPVLIERQNISHFIEKNFSERCLYTEFNIENYKLFLSTYNWELKIQKNDSYEFFEKYFNINSKLKDYNEIYSTKLNTKLFTLDFLFHNLLFFLKLNFDLIRTLFPKYNKTFVKIIKQLHTSTSLK